MLFNSLEFLAFYPVVVAVLFALPHRARWAWLLLASCVFYGSWSPWYLLLLLATATLDWIVGVRIADAPTQEARWRWLVLSLVSNLGVLFSFKYYNLFNDTLTAGLARLGVDWPFPHSEWVLPVGLSFYTFQSISYTVDVYRGDYPAERRPGMFLLYVAYFPHLVAGPIVRAPKLLPQLHQHVRFDWDRAASGLRLACWGMFKKVVIADRLAQVVDIVYGDPRSFGPFAWTIATFFFCYQVYCDFSGYSDIAIGIARVMGVDLTRNFDQPYLSRSMSEIWSRWHITMSTWFRDYVYVPLGGNRVPPWRWAFNVYVVMVGSGLWHGAQWSLTAWGAVHATLLVLERFTEPQRKWLYRVTGLERVPAVQALVQWACTFLLWQVTLVFFRSETLGDAFYILTHLPFGWERVGSPLALAEFVGKVKLDIFLLGYCILLCPFAEAIDFCFRTASIRERVQRWPTLVRWVLDWTLIVATIALGFFGATPFVYFQF